MVSESGKEESAKKNSSWGNSETMSSSKKARWRETMVAVARWCKNPASPWKGTKTQSNKRYKLLLDKNWIFCTQDGTNTLHLIWAERLFASEERLRAIKPQNECDKNRSPFFGSESLIINEIYTCSVKPLKLYRTKREARLKLTLYVNNDLQTCLVKTCFI